MSYDKLRILTAILGGGFVLASIVCVFLPHGLIDRSIAVSYLEDSGDASEIALRRVSLLLLNEWNGVSPEALLVKLHGAAEQSAEKEILVKQDDDGVILFDNVRFNFEAGKLKSIGPSE